MLQKKILRNVWLFKNNLLLSSYQTSTMRLLRPIITITKIDYFGESYEAKVEQPPLTKSYSDLWNNLRESFEDSINYQNENCPAHMNHGSVPVENVNNYFECLNEKKWK